MKISIYLLFFCSINIGYAQLINKWDAVYKQINNYGSVLRQNNLQSFGKDNLLIIDQFTFNTLPFLAVTNNAGLKWDTIFKSKKFEYDINAIAYPSKDRMIWVGDSSEYQGTEGAANYYFLRTGVFFTSIDAGKNWNKVKLDSNTMLDYVVMLDENTGIINKRNVSNMYNNNISFWDTLLYTENFFSSYTKIPVPDSITFVNKVFMFSKDNFIIKTENYLKKEHKYLETTDRGKTWTVFTDAYLTLDISFINRQTAYKIESKILPDTNNYESQIYKTTNGGTDWVYCFTPRDSHWGTSYHVNFISASDADNAIAIGTNCAIFRTNDGGITWNKEFAPNNKGDFDLEYDKLSTITYPKNDCSYIMGAGYILKMNGEKTLTRPILNSYTDKISPSGIQAFWEPVLGAKKYKLQIVLSTTDTYDYAVFDNPTFDTLTSDTSLVLPDFEYNHCYYGRIKAVSDNMESEWNIKTYMFCTLQNDSYTNPPVLITPKSGDLINTLFCEFKWTSVTGADEYQLQYCDNRFFVDNLVDFQSITDTVFKTPDLVSGKKYYAKLKVSKGTKITNWVYTNFTIADPTSVINFDFENNTHISIYPNPATDYIEINFEAIEAINPTLKRGVDEGSDIQIFDMLGVPVTAIHPMTASHRMNIENLSPGIYFIKIGNRVEKFVKM